MRKLASIASLLALVACEPRHSAPQNSVAPEPFRWTTLPDGRLQPPDGPCDRDQDCALRTDCGCGCFAVRTDFTDHEHRCVPCAAQVPLCMGATARCNASTHRCTVTR
jgi:hypothetical protein